MISMRKLAAAAAGAFIAAFTGTHAQSQTPIYGYVVINVTGGFRIPVSAGGAANCKGYVILAPTSSSNTTISALSALALFGSAVQSNTANATIAESKTNFTCTVVVPFQLNNATAASQQLVIGFSADAWDPGVFDKNTNTFVGATNPGRTKQLIQIAPVPTSNGATLTYNVQAYL
jgi:hypothetical protein